MVELIAANNHQLNGLARPARLWLRVGMLLMSVFALVLALVSFLNYSNYRKTYSQLELDRYLILAKDVRQTVVSGLDIGLLPSENSRLRPMIDEIEKREAGIRYFAVMEDSGQVVGDGEFPQQAASTWSAKRDSTDANRYWQASGDQTIEVGLPYVNNFNVKAGAVVVGYDRSAIDRASAAMRQKLIADTLGTIGILALLTFGGVYAVTHLLSRQLAAAARTIGAQDAASGPSEIEEGVLDDGIVGGINDFSALSRRALHDMAQIEAELAPRADTAPEAKP